jgi:endonuclease/exonuclease/phosphatase (EEP) superfamily protein YafD
MDTGRRKGGRALPRAIGNTCAAAVLLAWLGVGFSYLWPHDLRTESPAWLTAGWLAFMIRTQIFAVGFLVIPLGVALLALRRWGWLASACALVALAFVPEFVPMPPGRAEPIAGRTLRVMSVNLLAGNDDAGAVRAQIEAESPDVLLLQEYTPRWRTALEPLLGADYPHRTDALRDDCFGMAVWSKRPIRREGPLELGAGTVPQMRTVLEHEGREIAIYSVHLIPPMPRLGSIREQRHQLADLLRSLRDESLPAIVAGDFNATPRGPYMARLRDIGLREAHALAGSGRGATWRGHGLAGVLPPIRLDQIYLGADLTCSAARVLGPNGSDHRPVVADIGWSEPEPSG